MIVLDTHIWVWWVHGDERLTRTQAEVIEANETDVIGVSAIEGIWMPACDVRWQASRISAR